MITADKLTLLTNLPAVMLTTAIQSAGYKKDKFTKSKFIGITNAGQFCYKVTYIDNNEEQECKVFVTYNSANDSVTADY